MKIADKRKAGEALGRAGIAEMIIGFVDEFNKNDTYKAAVKLSGQLHAMAGVSYNITPNWSSVPSALAHLEVQRGFKIINKRLTFTSEHK